ncbi:hypothetical protein Tco_1064704 [Tanacetum coccineum]
MDDPNITMEEYIRLEKEKARRRAKVYNWETATYGKIWYDEDVHDLRSIETEFPAIVFNDALTSEVALSCEPTLSPINDNQIDFRISFDESDDEDYTVIYNKNSFSYKIIFVDDLKMNSENDYDKVNMPSFLSPEPSFNFLTETVVSPQHINEFDETSLSKCDDEGQNVIYFNNLFPFNIIYPNDLSDKDNDNDKIDTKHSSGDISVEPLPNAIKIDARWSNKFLETSHDTIGKIFTAKIFIKELNVNIVTWNYLNKGMSCIFLIKNLYVPFGIPFDPKLFYKDGIKLGLPIRRIQTPLIRRIDLLDVYPVFIFSTVSIRRIMGYGYGASTSCTVLGPSGKKSTILVKYLRSGILAQ